MPVAILEHIGRYVCCLKRGIYNSLHPPQGRASDWTAYTTAVIITAVNANQHPPPPPLPSQGQQAGREEVTETQSICTAGGQLQQGPVSAAPSLGLQGAE